VLPPLAFQRIFEPFYNGSEHGAAVALVAGELTREDGERMISGGALLSDAGRHRHRSR
jgi:hypothetical protein